MGPAIACFGAAHLDQKALAKRAVSLGASNPVRMRRSIGGVARNVAETLARLDCDVAVVSRVGQGPVGDWVLAPLVKLGLDLRHVGRSCTAQTASYTALIDDDGETVIALADMEIYEELTPEAIEPAVLACSEHALWFVDASLPEGTLRYLASSRPATTAMAVDAVSVGKAERLRPILGDIDLLFCNRLEAELLSGIRIRAPLDVTEAAHRLRITGVGAIVITLGSDGGFVASDRVYDFFQATPGWIQDLAGAGDALVAGVLYGYASGRPIDEAMALGMACAAMAMEVTATVNPGVNAPELLARAGLAA